MPDTNESENSCFMQSALALACQGQGLVEPNPMVGCVLVKDNQVVGQGFHEKFGGPHAEINAINSCDEPAGATAFVTLEPCCHEGKTGPCTQALIQSGVAQVVVAVADPFANVAGEGIRQLEQAGIRVSVGLLETKARELNAPYFKRLETGMPWVIAKWAMTLDGKIATSNGSSKWITNEQSREIVHQIRGRMDAIVVGIGTVLADDPLLTARPAGPRTALRVVVDASGSLPLDSQLVATVAEAPVVVSVGPGCDTSYCNSLKSLGCQILECNGDSHSQQLKAMLQQLGERGCTNVLVEGGSSVFGALNDGGLIDELHSFIAPKIVGGEQAVSPIGGTGVLQMSEAISLRNTRVRQLGDDLYVTGIVVKAAKGRNSSAERPSGGHGTRTRNRLPGN